MYCTNCGQQLNNSVKFFTNCGKKMEEKKITDGVSVESAEVYVKDQETPKRRRLFEDISLPTENAQSTSNTVSLPTEENSKFKGLGGWLVIVILALFINAGYSLYAIYNDINLFTNGTIAKISDPSFTYYAPGYSGLMTFEIISSTLLSIFAIYLIYLFFKTKKEFPKYYIAFLLAMLIFAIVEFAILQSFSDQIKTVISSAIDSENTALGQAFWGAVIWGLYMVKSKRVKATFIN